VMTRLTAHTGLAAFVAPGSPVSFYPRLLEAIVPV
jgi:hypothetical protein